MTGTTLAHPQREYGVVHEGNAQPIYCGHCGFSCYVLENMERHLRLHRARRCPQ